MKLRYKILNGFLAVLVVAIGALGIVIGYTSDCEPVADVASDGERMRAAIYRCYGSADVVEISAVEKPMPGDDEVLVKVQAASINPLDWHYMRGSPYVMRLGVGIGAPSDSTMGVDFAGVVVAVGKDVTEFEPGDEVFGGHDGAFAEYLTVRESWAIARKPENMSFAQAASSPIAGLTALQALRDIGKVKPGQKVLINGASGGVGTFAVQIAKSFGAEVTGVCSTRNLDMVRAIGADHVIDYKVDDYTKGDERYDVIVDMVGNRSLTANRQVMAPNGVLVIVGGAKGNWIAPFLGPIKALFLSPFIDQEISMILASLNKQDLGTLGDMMLAGKVTPVIERRYTLGEIADAIRHSEDGHVRGKLIIEMQ